MFAKRQEVPEWTRRPSTPRLTGLTLEMVSGDEAENPCRSREVADAASSSLGGDGH
jgi:hypothetical protein